MIRTLLWKEYREQRSTLVALIVFAVGLLVYVQYFVSRGSAQSIPPFVTAAECLVWLTGLSAGAQRLPVKSKIGRWGGWMRSPLCGA